MVGVEWPVVRGMMLNFEFLIGLVVGVGIAVRWRIMLNVVPNEFGMNVELG
jgi:hypothetical protein